MTHTSIREENKALFPALSQTAMENEPAANASTSLAVPVNDEHGHVDKDQLQLAKLGYRQGELQKKNHMCGPCTLPPKLETLDTAPLV